MNKNPNNPDFGESGFDSTDETLNNTTRINMPDEYSESNNPTQNYNPNFNSDFERNFNQNPVQNNNYQNYSDGSQNYNPNYNGGFNPNYNPNYNPNPYDRNNMYRRKSNTGLIVAISVMSVLAAVIIITIILFATNVISPGKSHNEQAVSTEAQVPAQQENTPPAQQPQTQPQKSAEQPVSVERTMFVGNCNISVTLRTGITRQAIRNHTGSDLHCQLSAQTQKSWLLSLPQADQLQKLVSCSHAVINVNTALFHDSILSLCKRCRSELQKRQSIYRFCLSEDTFFKHSP